MPMNQVALQVRVTETLHKAVRHKCVEEHLSLKETITSLLLGWAEGKITLPFNRKLKRMEIFSVAGSKGGKKSSAAMTPEERSARAKNAVAMREAKKHSAVD